MRGKAKCTLQTGSISILSSLSLSHTLFYGAWVFVYPGLHRLQNYWYFLKHENFWKSLYLNFSQLSWKLIQLQKSNETQAFVS